MDQLMYENREPEWERGQEKEWGPARPAGQQGKNSMALASMIVGILSIVTACCFVPGIILGGLAVIFSALSRVETRLAPQARVGLITGIAGMLLGICLFIVGILLRG